LASQERVDVKFKSYRFFEGGAIKRSVRPAEGISPAPLSSSPEITANWNASGNKWTVPVGGGLSKVVRIGKQPLKFGLFAYYNAIRPTASQDPWQLQATLTFIFSEIQARPVLKKEP
jgi:hypothetical protein